jgi:hypothetical protein
MNQLAVRASEADLRAGPLHREPALMHKAVMMRAEMDEIFETGSSSPGPVLDVMSV